jgi:hypothetical protein
MTVDLSKDDLVTLVIGCSPHHSLINKYSALKYGHWTGGFVDEWSWHKWTLEELNEEKLYDIFQECTQTKTLNV